MQVHIKKFCLALGILCGFSSWLTAREPTNCVLLYFSSTSCQACKAMSLAVRKASDQGWLVREVDADRERPLALRWKVTALPTIVVLESGKETDRVVGKLDSPALLSRLQGTPVMRIDAIDAVAPQPNVKRNVDPMEVSVRIRIEDHNSVSFGTGTIVDQHGAEALVITCGHLFRDITPASRVTVDLTSPSGMQTIPATVIDYQCQGTDIGLVSFPVSRPVAVAKLLPMGHALQPNEPVCSIGCDHGADPSRRDSHITKLNRYLGPANVEVAKAPVQGRSGGGLFNSRGELIGVCYAADQSLDEGLYSGPEVVYAQLQRLGLGRLYDQSHLALNSPNEHQRTSNQDSPGRSFGDNWKSAIDQAAIATRQATRDPAMQQEMVPSGSLLTATIHDAHGNAKQIRIPNPNPELIRLLQNQMSSSQSNTTFANSR
jgi:thiol-disulfide isomerase/thioredoxin